MDTKTEKKIERELNKAEREHDKAMIAEGKGHLHSAEKHENRAINHENRAGGLSGQTGYTSAAGMHPATMGVPAGGLSNHYTGLNYPYMGAVQHPAYGYHRLPRDKKAERFEAKAVEWDRRGNTVKAQKNRDKALRLRRRDQPGFVPTANPQPYYSDKATRFEQRALRYQSMGMLPQAQRYHQRALRTRTKHGITAGTIGAPMTSFNSGGLNNGAYVGPITPYTGLNHPMTGANQHPTFGYSRLNSVQKAERFEQKAALWAQKGNMAKSQKNKDKAMRYRQMNQAGYVKPTRNQDYYINRVAALDQKARQYQQNGRTDQAMRAQQRAQRIRTKHNIPAGAGLAGAGLAGAGLAGAGMMNQGMNRGMMNQGVNPGMMNQGVNSGMMNQGVNSGMMNQGVNPGMMNQGMSGNHIGQYQGLNLPYTGAVNHPQYGYPRLTRDQKIQRYEQKAALYEQRKNMAKAQKNRDKVLRYRQMGQPGYVRPTRAQDYYLNRANNFDQKAARYQQMGMMPQAQRYQGRSQRLRGKHNLPAGAALAGLGANRGMMNQGMMGQNQGMMGQNQGMMGQNQGMMGQQPIGQYQGLNLPYNNATAHPQYGYMRLPANDKALRFEQKAVQYEQRGNMAKAQKNREKALRYRARTQPGYTKPSRAQNFYADRAAKYDQKAVQYSQWGMPQQAQRYQGRAQRIRTKHNIPAAGIAGAGLGMQSGLGTHTHGQTWTTGQTVVGPLVNQGTVMSGTSGMMNQGMMGQNQGYQGLNFPYNNATAHPQYGYMRLQANDKALRFEQKAAQYEQRGNMAKAQKNREKALRYRARTQPGYTAPVRPQQYYVDRANLFDQRAQRYQQMGMQPQYQRYAGRSQRIRAKHNVPMMPMTQTTTTTAVPAARVI